MRVTRARLLLWVAKGSISRLSNSLSLSFPTGTTFPLFQSTRSHFSSKHARTRIRFSRIHRFPRETFVANTRSVCAPNFPAFVRTASLKTHTQNRRIGRHSCTNTHTKESVGKKSRQPTERKRQTIVCARRRETPPLNDSARLDLCTSRWDVWRSHPRKTAVVNRLRKNYEHIHIGASFLGHRAMCVFCV